MSFWLETGGGAAIDPQKRIKLFYYTHENAIQFS